jgi:ABC-type multidrug transport system fused ATPase/permease subunit
MWQRMARRLFSGEVSSELGWLGRRVRPLLPLLFVNLGAIVIGSALTLTDPLIVKWLIDVALPQKRLGLVLAGTGAFCAVYLASLSASFFASFVSSVVAQKLVFRIRVSLLRHIHRLSGRYHGNVQVGETLYRLEQDVERVAELSGDILPATLHMVVVGIMVLATMSALNWRLTALVVPLVPVFYLLQRRYTGRLKEAADQTQAQSGKINAFLQEHLAGMLQLQLLNRTGTQARRFARLAAEGAKSQVSQRVTEITFGGASVSVIVLGMSLILGFGGYAVTRGTLTLGGLVAFYGYVVRLFEPVSIAIDLQSRLQRVGASVRRILEIAEQKQSYDEAIVTQALGRDTVPALEFRSVWFSYSDDRPVLRGMSFCVDAGETVALVGLNGSGKSTVGLLATRWFEPTSGEILVGGVNVRDVSVRNLRTLVTLVPQDPVLFDATIRENLLYGNPGATDRDLTRVSGLTQLDAVLGRLPRGLHEPLGPQGGRLSGGEKKRLALARTLLQKPKVLMVDEITTALDTPTADSVMRGLDLFRGANTLLVISHRPATILWAERILVIDQGQVVDSGQHEELLARCEAYQRIWEIQDKQPLVEPPVEPQPTAVTGA